MRFIHRGHGRHDRLLSPRPSTTCDAKSKRLSGFSVLQRSGRECQFADHDALVNKTGSWRAL
jgi:hypothetical protein